MSGRKATTDVRPGKTALSVGNPKTKLPSGWCWALLEDVAQMATGHTPSRLKPQYWGGEIPWISVRDARPYNGKTIFHTAENISQLGLENSAAVLLPKDTVCLSRTGSIGYSIILGREMATSQGFVNWICSEGLNSRFLQLLFLAENPFLHSISEGVAHTTIYFPEAKAFHIALPPLKEQNRIVEKLDELLSELEKGKELLQTSFEQLKVYKQSILKHAFEGKLSGEWRSKQKKLKTPDELIAEIRAYRRQQYELQIKEYKAGKTKVKPKEPRDISLPTKAELKNKPELPKGWTYVALTEIVENESIKISPSKESKLKFVGMDCIEPHSLQPFKYHEFSDFKSAGNYFEKDRVLYGRMRPYLNKVWRTEFTGACSGEFLVLYPTPLLNPDFLKYKLHSAEYVTFAMNNISGDRPRISYDEVVSYIFPICSVDEQIEIVNQIEQLFFLNDVMEKNIEENLLKSQTLKNGLLHKAFEGKLVEQDPTEEPASLSLERIKKDREEYLKAEKGKKKIQKKPMKKKSAAKVFEFPLMDTIKDKFGRKSFTFDQLKSEVDINYDDLREELFSLLDDEKVLAMEFDQKKESITFKYIGK